MRSEELVTFLAYPWCAFKAEEHPRVRLHWLIDTAELCVRWAVCVALAEVRAAHGGELPRAVAASVGEHIERPTLGRWLGMLRELSGARPDGPREGAVFGLYGACLEEAFITANRGGALETSLLILRNQIAHGGGMSRAHAEHLLRAHEPRLEALVAATQAATAGEVWARHGDEIVLMRGEHPERVEALPEGVGEDGGDGVWLVDARGVLALEPIAAFGPVHVVEAGEVRARPGGSVSQIFTRASRERLAYTPLGRDEAHSEVAESARVERFRALFCLDDAEDDAQHLDDDTPAWDAQLKAAREEAAELVGRAEELAQLKAWLTSRQPHEAGCRKGWLAGGPGLGKSMLMARLATDYGSGSHRAVVFHRFGEGDTRNMRRAFLRVFEGALWAFKPLRAVTSPPDPAADTDQLIESLRARLAALSALEAPHPRAPKPSLWVLLDGFDVAFAQEPGWLELLRDLDTSGVVWLVAGRPIHGVDEVLRRDGFEPVFEQGLPPMSAADVRAMLLEGLGSARYALLRRDEDAGEEVASAQDVAGDEDGGAVHNRFIEQVVLRAKGLPLYVQLLLDDLRAGTLTVHDDDQLPDGLTAYYDGLMSRVGLSTVGRDLPLMVALLALSEEPLDAEALAALLCDAWDALDEWRARVDEALQAGPALFLRARAWDRHEGFRLYHQSLREYVAGTRRGGEETPPAPGLAGVVREARRKLCRAAAKWRELEPRGNSSQDLQDLQNLQRHLFRWGTTYALRWDGPRGLDAASDRLTDFEYIMARVSQMPASAMSDLILEYEEVFDALEPGARRDGFRVWMTFMRERAHLLSRPERGWGSHKALVQLAVEHADDSPVTQAAEAWLAQPGRGDWLWWRAARRPETVAPSLSLRVFEGHRKRVEGAHLLDDGRALSWSSDGTLHLWDLETGTSLATLRGHADVIEGVILTARGRALSWDRAEPTARLWALDAGEQVGALEGHARPLRGALSLSDDRALTWSDDRTLRLWQIEPSGAAQELCQAVGHTRAVAGAVMLPDGGVLSWSDDRTLRRWSATLDPEVTFEGHTAEVLGAHLLPDGRVWSWGRDHALILWSAEGDPLATMTGHADLITAVEALPDGRILSCAKDHTLRLWSADGEPIATLTGHRHEVYGVVPLPDGRVVSWSRDATLRVWDLERHVCTHTLRGHASWVRGACLLDATHVLSWSGGGTLRVWSLETGQAVAVLEGHMEGVRGALPLGAEEILSWSWDATLRSWRWSEREIIARRSGHRGFINACDLLDDGRLLSWGSDGLLIAWDEATGEPTTVFEGHERSISGAAVYEDRLLSWSSDQTLRWWDLQTGALLSTMSGHEKVIQGARALGDGRAVSWSSDATIRLWSLDSGALLHTLSDHKKLVQGARVLPDGRLISWSSDATIRLWSLDPARPHLLHTLSEHTKLVREVQLLPDGRALSASSDNTLRLWSLDPEAPRCLATLTGHTKLVQTLRVFPEHHLAVSLAKDDTIRVWSLDPALDAPTDDPDAPPEADHLLHTLDAGDLHDGVALMEGDPLRLLSWSRKQRSFFVWDLATGALIERVALASARHTRPDLWRARLDRAPFTWTQGPWRAHAHTGGATLYHDALDDEETLADHLPVSWLESGKWTPGALHPNLSFAVHTNHHLHVLQLYRGAGRASPPQDLSVLPPLSRRPEEG